MLETTLPLLLAVLLAVGLGSVLLLLASRLGPRRLSRVKAEAFESGNPSSGPAREPFTVKFYLMAILFLLFDIEAVFLFPWAVVLSGSAKSGEPFSPLLLLAEMAVFVGLLLVGLAYAWRKGALEWGPEPGASAASDHE